MSAYGINKVCYLAEWDPAFRQRLKADPAAAVAGLPLEPEETHALVSGDVATLYRRGGHPFLLQHLARFGIAGLDQAAYLLRMQAASDETQ